MKLVNYLSVIPFIPLALACASADNDPLVNLVSKIRSLFKREDPTTYNGDFLYSKIKALEKREESENFPECSDSDACRHYENALFSSGCDISEDYDDAELANFYTCVCDLSDDFWDSSYMCTFCVETADEDSVNIVKSHLCSGYYSNSSDIDLSNSTYTNNTLCNRYTDVCYELTDLANSTCGLPDETSEYVECVCGLSNDEYWNYELECYLCSDDFLDNQVSSFKDDLCSFLINTESSSGSLIISTGSTTVSGSSSSSIVDNEEISGSSESTESESESESSSSSAIAANQFLESRSFILSSFSLVSAVLISIL
ncbi:uncharacterized protein ASCRUDRAFT_76709 [Ascoidea rubescens DSM 1968]|uniref:Uncharacterized protein n=1 Tax=Ascoidea rubescens DSM 1968 TaxID=1344418 RepID=A0A1D2VF34_9ASCO|nr:hypothetical protein ASCRUDRAFT_76709 [Ascoidea rubescens DSM 1968]ODV60219.1 hypothetical protein ASCRUDRAFT_76709 [Ascoidea rubescens DSM 1968]